MEEKINQSGSVVVAVIVAVVITALLVGGGFYVWQRQVGKNKISSEFTKMQINNHNMTTNKLDDLKSIKTSKYIVTANDGLVDGSRPMILVSDINGKVILKLLDQEALPGVMGIWGIDESGRFFYQCNGSGYAGGRVDVYDLKTGKIVFTESDSDKNILDQCKYNSDDNTLSYIVADSWGNMGRGYINAIKKVYSFDNGSIMIDKNIQQDSVSNGDENVVKSEIDNWLTFKDQDFGIEFKYPDKNYTVNRRSGERHVYRDGGVIKTEEILIKNINDRDQNLVARYRIYKTKENFIIPKNIETDGDGNAVEDKVINGIKYSKYKLTGMGEPYGYFVKKNGYFYTFETVFAPEGSKESQIFEDIMKTVKFK